MKLMVTCPHAGAANASRQTIRGKHASRLALYVHPASAPPEVPLLCIGPGVRQTNWFVADPVPWSLVVRLGCGFSATC